MSEPVFILCTDAQLAVLKDLMVDGATNRTIAGRLFLSVDTVKSHMRKLLANVGAHDRTSLAIKLLRKQVVIVDRRGRVHEF